MFLLGKKVKMDQMFKDGKMVPVTVIRTEGVKVDMERTEEKDGYKAIRLSLPISKKKSIKREFRTERLGGEMNEVNETVDLSCLAEGDKVAVSANIKGRGFQGGVKRWGFAGGPKSHGQKDRHRAPGSIGAGGVQRVFKGLKMAGHMGTNRKTVKNLQVVAVDAGKGIIMLKGAVPGYNGTVVEIRKAISNK